MAYTSVVSTRCGVDIIYIPGIAKLQNDGNSLEKFFDPAELTKSTTEHLAGIIAAKEAFFKALGIVPKFRDVTITYEETGKPKLTAAPTLQKYTSCDISISHDNDYAVAFVVLEI